MRPLLPVLVLSVLFWVSIDAIADEIVIAADAWCPYNCDPDSAEPGYVVELAQTIFTRAGHQVTYETLPWRRALRAGLMGRVTAVIGISDEPEGERMVLPEEPMGLYRVAFFTDRNSDWRYKNIQSLKNMRVGVIRGYAYFPQFDRYQAEHPQSINVNQGKAALERNLLMVLNDRIDLTLDDLSVANYTIQRLGIADQVRLAGVHQTAAPLYLAFSPNNPKSHHYARIWSAGIRQMRQSGELDTLLEKYNLTDWQASQ